MLAAQGNFRDQGLEQWMTKYEKVNDLRIHFKISTC